jgi:hypothetical protein
VSLFQSLNPNQLQLNFLAVIFMVALAYSAEIFGELTFHSLTSQIWALPFLIYLNVIEISNLNRWVLWAVITLLIGYPNPHPIQVGWNSRNSNAVRTRTVSAACYNMFVQTGGIISSYVYQQKASKATSGAPNYKTGNRILLGVACGNIVLYLLTKTYYVWRNKTRDRKWAAMTEDEQLDYLKTTTDEGSKRLDFRFAH